MSEFKKKSYSAEDRKKWGKILTPDFVSSDESGVDEGKGVIFVKDIPWRGQKITNFFQKLDDSHSANKSEQASRQTKERIKIGTWYLNNLHQ